MITRFFRRRSTGEWLETTITSSNGFSTPTSAHIRNIESGYNLPGDITVVEAPSDQDPRSGTLLAPPAQPPRTSPFYTLDELTALIDSATDLDSLKTALITLLPGLNSIRK